MNSEENWKAVIGYEGLYEVSDCGNIRNCRSGRILKPGSSDKDGYLHVVLCKNGKRKTFKVHRLVAIAFIPNPENLSDVNHKDECKSNNRLDNLEWMSRKDNANYGTRNHRIVESRGKSTKGKRYIICLETNEVHYDSEWRKLGFYHVWYVAQGRQKTCLGLHFRYVD